MAINERASSDARHARTGKDAGLYNGTGDLLASMESFQAKATYNNVKYKPIKFAEETDNAKFRSSLIYHATVEEDRTKLWDNQQVWDGLRKQGVLVVTALDVIEAVLLGGEKDRVIDEINKLSGFDSENLEEVENKMEETAKN